MSETLSGKVKWFNDAKGYGFIEHESGRDVFVHYSVINIEGYKTLKDGEPVEYEIIEGEKGLHAKNVRRLAVEDSAGLSAQVEVSSAAPEQGEEFSTPVEDSQDEPRIES